MKFQCRTAEMRKNLISQFSIQPVAHVKLLNGQERKSCTNVKLTDSYYCFSCKEKNKDESSIFFCGKETGEHFIELLNLKKIPLFNPLSTKGLISGSISATTSGTRTTESAEWNPTAKQLYIAINFLVICWGSSIGRVLLDIKIKLEASKTKEPFNSQVKAVNTIISHDKRNRTLQIMIEELRRNNNVRKYNFDLLNAILAKMGITESHFG